MVDTTQPDGEVVKLLSDYDACGGVLEFAFFKPTSAKESVEVVHRDAARQALVESQKRNEAWIHSFAPEDLNEFDISRDTLFHVEIPMGFEPRGRQISIESFLGPLYSKSGGFVREPVNGLYAGEDDGFTYAFLRPPHGHIPKDLFLSFLDQVLEGCPMSAEIWQWETKDLNYFDEGREWWGTFYWTYRASPATQVVAILGSATD